MHGNIMTSISLRGIKYTRRREPESIDWPRVITKPQSLPLDESTSRERTCDGGSHGGSLLIHADVVVVERAWSYLRIRRQ